jgi:N-acetylglucosamine malate deacetylase 1
VTPMGMLVLSPHADDEVLGCSAFLGVPSHVLYLGIDEFHVVTRQQRVGEVCAVARLLGFTWEASDFTVNRYYERFADLVQVIEAAISRRRPGTVLAPIPSYNQDHRAVYEATLAATRRHDRNHFVPRVLLYEEPDNFLDPVYPFRPAYYVPVDIKAKLAANELHASQRRGHRSPAILTTMATFRGMQSHLEAAEAFEVVRWVDAGGLGGNAGGGSWPSAAGGSPPASGTVQFGEPETSLRDPQIHLGVDVEGFQITDEEREWPLTNPAAAAQECFAPDPIQAGRLADHGSSVLGTRQMERVIVDRLPAAPEPRVDGNRGENRVIAGIRRQGLDRAADRARPQQRCGHEQLEVGVGVDDPGFIDQQIIPVRAVGGEFGLAFDDLPATPARRCGHGLAVGVDVDSVKRNGGNAVEEVLKQRLAAERPEILRGDAAA